MDTMDVPFSDPVADKVDSVRYFARDLLIEQSKRAHLGKLDTSAIEQAVRVAVSLERYMDRLNAELRAMPNLPTPPQEPK